MTYLLAHTPGTGWCKHIIMYCVGAIKVYLPNASRIHLKTNKNDSNYKKNKIYKNTSTKYKYTKQVQSADHKYMCTKKRCKGIFC